MISAKDIKANTKLPTIIRDDYAFRNDDAQYDKVFDHIGLKNHSTPLQKMKPTFRTLLASSVYGMRANLSRGNNKSWIKNIFWGIVGTPLLFCDLLVDLWYCYFFKKQFADQDLQIVFASNGQEGAWDIATMSMRGISSCQTWNAGQSNKLVGSITDPCCGIIYITNGKKTKYGTEMLYRSVVRYVFTRGIGPCLFMEQTYPVSKKSSQIRAVNMLFASALHAHTKLPVMYDYCFMNSYVLNNMDIPNSQAVHDALYNTSYRDSGIKYRNLTQTELEKYPSLKTIQEKYLKVQ